MTIPLALDNHSQRELNKISKAINNLLDIFWPQSDKHPQRMI
jgi:hypothetical protein